MPLLNEVVAIRDNWSIDYGDRAWIAIELIAQRLDELDGAQREAVVGTLTTDRLGVTKSGKLEPNDA